MLKKCSLILLTSLNLVSCRLPSLCANYFNELSVFWKTNDSNIVFYSLMSARRSKTDIDIPIFRYINYNYSNLDFSILFRQTYFHNPNEFIMDIYSKNGGDNYLDTFFIKTKCTKHNEIIHINTLCDKQEKEISTEELETNKYYSIFKNDTSIEKYQPSELYLINLCASYLSNDDIKLCSSSTQFSFLTGKMLDQNNNYINVIFKSTSNTTFKIYEFKNKEEVGDVLLEGNLTPLQKSNNNWYIDLNVTKDYYFNNKYTSFYLNIKERPINFIEECDANINFYFPEDIN